MLTRLDSGLVTGLSLESLSKKSQGILRLAAFHLGSLKIVQERAQCSRGWLLAEILLPVLCFLGVAGAQGVTRVK